MFPKHRLLALVTSLIFALVAPGLRAENPTPPIDPSIVLNESDYGAFHLVGTEAAKAEFSIQSLNELGFTSALDLKTNEACSSPFAAQIGQPTRTAIKKGDTLLAHFYLRTLKSSLESEEGTTELVLENATTFSKIVQFHASGLKDWKEFFVPFVADADYSPGQASIIFRMGYQPQEIEIAGVTIKNFGAQGNLASLSTGVTKLQYAGQAPDAPWRTAADQRIEKIRKADLKVQVVDGSGHPVGGADVSVQQTKHAYWFGSAVRAERIMQGPTTDEQAKYRATVTEMFNAVTFENNLKWPFWTRDVNVTLPSAKWLAEQGIALRGHVFVWPSHEKGLPDTLYPLVGNPDELRKAILDHIDDVTAQLQPQAAAWDVLNEPFNNHEFMDVLGRDAMPTWFQEAHEDSPQSRLFINDWGIVTSHGNDTVHQDDYEKTITYLIANKAPLDGIGVQGHFGSEPTPPEKMLEVLDRFGKFGKEIQMTEYSTQFSDPNDAATYLRDCLTVFFSHPSTSGFILWGFRDGIGMKNQSFLYDKDWNLTPSGKVWKDLVYGKWWTIAQAVTAANGHATINGFLGQYKVTARYHGKETQVTAELKPGGTALKVVLAKQNPGLGVAN